ncbi:MAG TPA: hypothetical protein VHV26_17545 [Rhizomicrobium sp.]|jgi:hypothetical protein|nr:hypothetical protein [Rhizomicrobium sp.]
MILRAAFFIGLVYLLAPHEPDLGLGRPHIGNWLPSAAAMLPAAGLPQAGQICSSCRNGIGGLLHMPRSGFSLSQGRGLSDVKAEIENAIRVRRERPELVAAGWP